MTISIDKTRCNGCGNASESRCVRICPGDLLYKDAVNKANIRSAKDCWDCAACVKECPCQAIAMYLPAQIGGRGSTLKAKGGQGHIVWHLTKPDGTEEIFDVRTRNYYKE